VGPPGEREGERGEGGSPGMLKSRVGKPKHNKYFQELYECLPVVTVF